MSKSIIIYEGVLKKQMLNILWEQQVVLTVCVGVETSLTTLPNMVSLGFTLPILFGGQVQLYWYL